ncbi:MAG TPA: hypothetical protein VEX61_07805 [Burkholderiales bacterium]|nr:hypothetical protein [Burkholderiales bacterium]
MRLFLLAVLSALGVAVSAANPASRAEAPLDKESLQAIAGWLKDHGREGYIGADVADAMGIPRLLGEDLLAARQRGFKTDDELRIAQISADGMLEFILFMVQRPDDQVYFYLSTPHGGLQKAFVSIPSKNLVLPLERIEAEPRFRREVLYWRDRSETR